MKNLTNLNKKFCESPQRQFLLITDVVMMITSSDRKTIMRLLLTSLILDTLDVKKINLELIASKL